MRLLFALLLFLGVSVTPADRITYPDNSCVPVAAAYQYSYLNAAKVNESIRRFAWSRLVRVERGFWQRKGHALCVFEISTGQVFSYDSLEGSVPLRTKSHDLQTILERLHENDPEVVSATWLD